MTTEYLNPEALFKPRGFTHVITVSGPHKTIYVGAQDSVDEKGETVGRGRLRKQTEQILGNIEKALDAAGAKLENIVKWSVYIVQGQNPQDGFEVFQEKWGDKPNPPAITVLFVSGLSNPDWLVEIEAIAIVPE